LDDQTHDGVLLTAPPGVGKIAHREEGSSPACVRSAVGFFELAHQVEDAVRRSPELADDLAIVGILLALERPSRLVDVPEALRHLLTLSISYSKHSMGRRQFLIIQSPS
jgi:hypothetical protein